ncbi:MAG: PorT family protein [Tannerellaceae bacterium]|jgi:hypothetical protein|nr:PorT family protein [Tannerellaceae bacterium]
MIKAFLTGLFLLYFLSVYAQNTVKVADKMFNWGAKAGLNSTFPIINSIEVDGQKAENIQLQYKVGVLAAAFCRFNINRFFVQPSISWRHASGDIRFNLPSGAEAPAAARSFDLLTYKVKSIEAPVLTGYKIVNEGPYGLSFMGGPTIKYRYDVSYLSNFFDSPRKYVSDSTPWGISFVCGVGVTIWRFFFDVTYEFGLNQVDSDFKDNRSSKSGGNDLSIDKHTNVMSFSLGFLF